MRRRGSWLVAVLATCAVAVPAVAHPGASSREKGGAVFGFEHNVTNVPNQTGGIWPELALDRFGDIFLVARKDTPVGVVQAGVPPLTASSWSWISTDDGQTWDPLDGLTPGHAVNVAADDADFVHVVDTFGPTIARYAHRMTGRGKTEGATAYLHGSEKFVGSVDPLFVAHAGGNLVYFADAGPLALARGGRYAAYNLGGTTGTTGLVLEQSESCGVAADHRKGAKNVYAVCTDGAGVLYAFSSHTYGITYERTIIGKYVGESTPAVVVDRAGVVWVLYADRDGSQLVLFRSANGGKNWSARDITKKRGTYRSVALAASPNGKLGIAAYYLPADTKEVPSRYWYILGGIWNPALKTPPVLVNFADHDPVSTDPADPLDIGPPAAAFDRAGHLNLAWAPVAGAMPTDVPAPLDLVHDIWHVASVTT